MSYFTNLGTFTVIRRAMQSMVIIWSLVVQPVFAQPFLTPQPQEMVVSKGAFSLTRVRLENQTRRFSILREWMGKQAAIQVWQKDSAPPKGFKPIRYQVNFSLPMEGYELSITPEKILIQAAGDIGFLYAEQSLIQLAEQSLNWTVPCLEIKDAPRFGWRGMHLDESRHFMGKSFVLKYIDWLCALKMNVFHWHLTDAPGWRIEIKKYPRLTEVGAWRPDRTGILFGEADTAKVGEPHTYGGFYTQEDVREIVAYASKRNITIIPEIEMPGHCTAALVAYPQYSCTGGPFAMPGGGKNSPYPNFCVGNEETYQFLEDILSEVINMFPSTYIHIGGDEVEREQWKHCAKCQARKELEHLENEAQLQVYFTKRIEQYLLRNGRQLLGWDEIMEGDNLSNSAGVMVWRGEDQARKATQRGNLAVLTHNYYFDLYQGNPAYEPITYGYLPLERVYQYEPVPEDFSADQRSGVLGVQGCLWTENIYSTRDAEYMIFPRLFALAEVAWTNPAQKSWENFQKKVVWNLDWLKKRSTHFASSMFDPEIHMAPDSVSGSMVCKLVQQIPFGELRYTIDGSEPNLNSPKFIQPVPMSRRTELKTAVFLPSGYQGKTRGVVYEPTKATGQKFALAALPDARYNGDKPHILTDGLSGSQAFHDGRWCGFYGVDFDWKVTFDKPEVVQKLSINWLDAERSWIYLPEEMQVEISTDGISWKQVQVLSNSAIRSAQSSAIKSITVSLPGEKVKQLRVFARNKGQHPVYADGKCWLFVDEIRID